MSSGAVTRGEVEPRRVGRLHAARDQLGERARADAQQQHARAADDLLESAAQLAQRHRAMEGGERGRGLHAGRLRALQPALDRGEQLLQCDRLFQVVDRADAGGLDRGVDGAVPRHHHHRHVELAVGRPLLEQGDAVGVGHPDVEQHHVGTHRVAGGARGGRVLGEQDVVALVAEDLREQFADTDFVVERSESLPFFFVMLPCFRPAAGGCAPRRRRPRGCSGGPRRRARPRSS